MTTYLYETIPNKPGAKARRFEFRQSMKDPALTSHPETGEPVRRIVTGGYGIMTSKKPERRAPARSHCCGSGSCHCH